jgi:proline iminopeptidase
VFLEARLKRESMKNKKTIKTPHLSIHGTPQKVYVHRCPNPKATLLFLHGGPGWADAPWSGIICKKLWAHFNTVHWDQRGCNGSFQADPDPMPWSIEDLVNDGIELCHQLKEVFGIEKPILIGHSWGSLLGIQMAQKAPELFQSFIGLGQVICLPQSEPLGLNLCKRKAEVMGRDDLLQELQALPEDFYHHLPLLFRQREIASELGGELLQPADSATWERWMLESPEVYQSHLELLHRGCEWSCQKLWTSLTRENLLASVKQLEIPIRIFQGRHDAITTSEPILQWLKQLKCPGNPKLEWFEASAHWPQIEENAKFCRLLLEE